MISPTRITDFDRYTNVTLELMDCCFRYPTLAHVWINIWTKL